MNRAPYLVAVFTCVSASGGCAVTLGAAAGPTFETTANVGGEGSGEARSAVGTEDVRAFVGLGAGGGYLARSHAGYGMIVPMGGVDFGREIRGSIDAFYAARILGGTVNPLRNGLGLGGEVLFTVARRGGEHARVLIGPRLSIEHVWGADGEPNRALVSLMFAVRWITFDTTANRW